VAAVIGSAVVPTLIANAFYLPRHFLGDANNEVKNKREPASGIAAAPETGA